MHPDDTPFFRHSSFCAAHVVNLLAGDYPGGKAQLYSRVLYTVLAAMYAAHEELVEIKIEPSDN